MRKAKGKRQTPKGKKKGKVGSVPPFLTPPFALRLFKFAFREAEVSLPRRLVEDDRERHGHVEAFDRLAHGDADCLVRRAQFFVRKPPGLRADDDGARHSPVNPRVISLRA